MTTNRVFSFVLGVISYAVLLIVLPIVTRPQFERLFMFAVSWIIGGGVLVFGSGIVYSSLLLQRSCTQTLFYFGGNGLIAFAIASAGLGLSYVTSPSIRTYTLASNSNFWWFAGIVGALVWLVASSAYYSRRGDEPAPTLDEGYKYVEPVVMMPHYASNLKVGADGELVAVSQSSEQGIITLHGMGTQATQVVYLDMGRYQLEYSFANDSGCELTLVYVDDPTITNQPILQGGGSGSKTFAAQFIGRYVFEVRCPQPFVTWEFRFYLL